MRSESAGATDPGRRRSSNEDAFVVDDSLGLVVVCDGIGGRRGGGDAARTAAEFVRAELHRQRSALARIEGSIPEDWSRATLAVEMAIQRACAELHGQNTRGGTRMGTTCTLAIRVGGRAIVGHVGNTRAYVVRAGTAHRLTEDHTMAALQLKAGVMTVEEAQASRLRGVLTRTVGAAESVQVDTFVLDLAHDDRVVVCSDGLYQHVPDAELAEIVVGAPPRDATAALVHLANARSGSDNVTVTVTHATAAATDLRATRMQRTLAALAEVRIFHQLSYKEKAAVMAIASDRAYASGDWVLREGDAGAEMFVVLEGEVKIERASVELARLGPGGHFGEMAVMDYAPRSADVRAAAPTRLLVLSQTALTSLMRSDPVLGVKLLWALGQELSLRLRASTAELVDWRRPDTPRTPSSPV